MPPETSLTAFKEVNSHRLFPYTPVEVTCDDEDSDNRRYHVFIEGEWDSWEKSIKDLSIRLREVAKKLPPDIYEYDGSRVNPDWDGWRTIKRFRNA